MSDSSELSSAATQGKGVRVQWGVRIPLRDGVRLNATLYLPELPDSAAPVIFTLTPYTGQTYHRHAMYFAQNGLPFLTVDVRGRAESEDEFRPFLQEAPDGYDIVEWLSAQRFCNGQVAMWGGSYAGYDQWATAKECPPHLATIAPAASVYPGLDFPMRNNIPGRYSIQWLTFVAGRVLHREIFGDERFWADRFRGAHDTNVPFSALDTFVGNPSRVFQDWAAHPEPDAFWDSHVPTPEQYAALSIPILTITGIYDGDQPGALAYYRAHLAAASREVRAKHYLVIGPWDHAGTREPRTEFVGLKAGPASLLDLQKLHLQWYRWAMLNGPKPEFLRKNVAYYVMGADEWRYADSLPEITAREATLYLGSQVNPADVFTSGWLSETPVESAEPDHYVYDPLDVRMSALEAQVDPESAIDQRVILANRGRLLVYHSAPFERATEICGLFRLSVWIAIDRPDTDFQVSIHEIDAQGASLLLSTDCLRARYRESLRAPKLVETTAPLRYDFERFTFVACRMQPGSRLRLVIGPSHSIYRQKNYNDGGLASDGTAKDAQAVTVRVFHDRAHRSVLHVPCGTPV